MPRPALYDADELMDAARGLILERGPRSAGIREIARRSGAPSGSLYHRFGSRDNLVGITWLRAVRRFQSGFLDALADEIPERAVERAIAWSVDYALSEPADTRLLLSHGRRDLLDGNPGAHLAAQIALVNEELEQAVCALARRLFGALTARNVERVTYAVIDLPSAVLRRHVLAGTLSRRAIPPLRSAALSIIAGGEQR
jgi:AcrR family transcriptional regulator